MKIFVETHWKNLYPCLKGNDDPLTIFNAELNATWTEYKAPIKPKFTTDMIGSPGSFPI